MRRDGGQGTGVHEAVATQTSRGRAKPADEVQGSREAAPEGRGEADFEGFFGRVYPRLAGALVLLIGDSAEAEEIAQEAMARVCERWERVQRMSSPEGYAFRTALNLNKKRLRRLAVRLRWLAGATRAEGPGVGPDPSGDALSAVEIRNDVRRALAHIPPAQREALVLVDWLEMDSRETGEVLGIDASSVRSRVQRARAALRELLGGRQWMT